MSVAYVDTPIGTLTVLAGPLGLQQVLFDGQEPGDRTGGPRGLEEDGGLAEEVARQIGEYFAGSRDSFDVPLDLRGTSFQQSVWRALATVPYGETISYGEQARRVGRPAAARAVGAANGRNPVPIVLPCHRVVGANGSLTGFGGGLDVKAALLAHEAEQLQSS